MPFFVSSVFFVEENGKNHPVKVTNISDIVLIIMAEGGILPWKTNRDNTVYADYSNLQKPLQSPPVGFSWIRSEKTGEWELLNESNGERISHISDLPPLNTRQKPVEAVKVEELADFIEHVVMPEDTLQGICLRYKVKVNILRRINGFTGDHFRTEKILRIPTEQLRNSPGAVFLPQTRTDDVLVQLFKGETGLGSIEARLYLEDHEFDLEKAKAAWKADEEWEDAELKKQAAITETVKKENTVPVVVVETTVLSSKKQVDVVLATEIPVAIEMATI